MSLCSKHHFTMYAILERAYWNMANPMEEVRTAEDVVGILQRYTERMSPEEYTGIDIPGISDRLVGNIARMLLDAGLIVERKPFCYMLTFDGLKYYSDDKDAIDTVRWIRFRPKEGPKEGQEVKRTLWQRLRRE